ncbi:hypothetical protein BH20ACI2_BH20ACI2_27360 [soil metagenome]
MTVMVSILDKLTVFFLKPACTLILESEVESQTQKRRLSPPFLTS